MSLKTYSGSCHCGKVRFEADLDLSAGTVRCNCSLCFKARAWFAFAKGAEHFRLLNGVDALNEYRWVPPSKSEPFLTYAFCRHCGVRVFCRTAATEQGSIHHAVTLTALDDAAADLAEARVQFVDGRHDRFDQPPADVRLL
jgi:hypothetical protein